MQEQSFLEDTFYHLITTSFEQNNETHLHLARTLSELLEAENALFLMGAIKNMLVTQIRSLEAEEGICVTECVPWNCTTLWIRKWH